MCINSHNINLDKTIKFTLAMWIALYVDKNNLQYDKLILKSLTKYKSSYIINLWWKCLLILTSIFQNNRINEL